MKITSNQREVLAATDSISGLASAVTATNNRLDVNATVSVAGVSTAVNQTNGLQLTQIVDAGGDLVTVTGGKLDVNATISGAGGGTSSIDKVAFTVGSDTGTPAMGIFQTVLDTITSGTVAVAAITTKRGQHVNLRDNSGAEVGIAAAPLQVSLANTAANATAVKVDGSAANQPVTLTAETTKVIGVTRTADGAGNLLTSTGNALDVNLKTSAATVTVSGSVTANAGTNLNTSALALDTSVSGLLVAQASTTLGQSGPLAQTATTTAAPTYTTAKTNPLSTDTSGNLRVSFKDTPSNTNNLNVNLAASAATVTVSGTVTTTPPSNASTNIAQINAVTPLMGNGITGTGSLRVTIASDNTAFAVNSTLSAETTKVIGVVRTADGSGNLYSSNSTTYTAKFAQDGNLLGTLGTAFSTAGKIDVKGADGDVFVRQATASNLNATVVGTGTFVTQSTLAAETTKVIGTVRTLGNAGAVMDGVNTAATAPANGLLTLGIYNSTEPSPTTGQSVGVQLDSKGRTRQVIMDAAGNTRGANVNASSQLSVSVDNTPSVNATLAAETTKVIGTINVAAAQTIAVTNTGTFATQSTLAAETTKVIGVVRTSDGAGNLLTSNSTTYTAKFGLDGNLLGTLGTAFSTAGKVDVKGADGDVFVRQATGTNLHTVLDSGTLTTLTTITGTTTLTPGTGLANLGKAEDQASADTDVGVGALAIRKATPVNTSGTDGDYEFAQLNAGRLWTWAQPNVVTISTTITRPGDTNAYAANDAYSNSTTVPTAGGYTFTGAALVSGGTGIITDCIVSASAATAYNGEIWVFDQAVTAINDNAAFTITDGEAQTLIGIIPFQTTDITAANSVGYTTGLNIGYTCIGTANLRFLVKIMTAVTPGNAEVLAVRIKVSN